MNEPIRTDHRAWPRQRVTTGPRRRVVVSVSATGAGLLGLSLSSPAGSPRFYALTLATAATWIVGGLVSGPPPASANNGRSVTQPIMKPILVGSGAFGMFYGCAIVARRIPVLDRTIAGVLTYSDMGDERSVLATTLLNGLSEEIFFRGAVYAAAGTGHPIAVSTAVYSLVTTATRNPALVVASAVMGSLFGVQRHTTGGLQAPIITHLVWSTLMLRYLPPLFHRRHRVTSRSAHPAEASRWLARRDNS